MHVSVGLPMSIRFESTMPPFMRTFSRSSGGSHAVTLDEVPEGSVEEAASSHLKRGVEDEELELIQVHSKKVKHIENRTGSSIRPRGSKK